MSSWQLVAVFEMSKYMKTGKNTPENYKKQLPGFEKFTEPKILILPRKKYVSDNNFNVASILT